jgi:thymidylate synthase
MQNYLDMLKYVMYNGEDTEGRNGFTRRVLAYQCRWNLKDGFPAVTTKQLYFKLVKSELLWFLKGDRSIESLRRLTDSDTTIWDHDMMSDRWAGNPNRRAKDDVGRIYGLQWRRWRVPDGTQIDQISNLIKSIKKDPYSRYHVVTAWNPGELDQMCLPPCHVYFQCQVGKNGLSLFMCQRSCDLFLGVPFNIASYALLTHILAQVTGYEVNELVIDFVDAHIYHKHFDAVNDQLCRRPLPLSRLWLNPEVRDIDSFDMNDIKLLHYQHHPAIKAAIQ